MFILHRAGQAPCLRSQLTANVRPHTKGISAMNRRRQILGCIASIALSTVALNASSQTNRRIQLSQLESMFGNMRQKTKWNVDSPLLWGYFFFDKSPEKLQSAATKLKALGYSVVELRQVESKPTFRLHVEKVEFHTPESLHARNSEFYELAERLGISTYDGMDVGPAPTSKP